MHPSVVDQTFEGAFQRRETLALPPGKKMSFVEVASQKKSSVTRSAKRLGARRDGCVCRSGPVSLGCQRSLHRLVFFGSLDSSGLGKPHVLCGLSHLQKS